MRFDRRTVLLALALVLALTLLGICVSAAPGDPPPTGDWFVTEQVEYKGKTGTVHGNLTIDLGGQLTLEDCVLTIEANLTVGAMSTLMMKNATVQFAVSPLWETVFMAAPQSTVTIIDGDNDQSTTGDRSVLNSTTSIGYNMYVLSEMFTLSNSLVSKCGVLRPNPLYDEGLIIKTDSASIQGSEIVDGYYGLVLDGVETCRLNNLTIRDCVIGLVVQASRDCEIIDSNISGCSETGMLLVGFNGNLQMLNDVFTDNAQNNVHFGSSTGFSNVFMGCTIGNGGQVGLLLETSDGIVLKDSEVTGCNIGIDIVGGAMELMDTTVSECVEGLRARNDANLLLQDMTIDDAGITILPGVITNFTFGKQIVWTAATGELACHVKVLADSRLTLEGCALDFSDSGGEPKGIQVLRRGELRMFNSSVTSSVSGGWLFNMADGSLSGIKDCTLSRLGVLTGPIFNRGMFIGGSGYLEGLTISDSETAIVVGKSRMSINDITIRDCALGILCDGNIGKGGIDIQGLVLVGCQQAMRVVSEGSVTINQGVIDLAGEGFNLTTGAVTLRDCWVGEPANGMFTATLRSTSTLDIINSQTSEAFWMTNDQNRVSFYWYLNLTLTYLSNGSPLSGALVTVKEKSGRIAIKDSVAGPDGKLEKLEMQERALTPDLVVTTPHIVSVSIGGLLDSFEILMEGSRNYEFAIDNHPPALTVFEPEDGATLSTSSVTFSGEAYDSVITDTGGLALLRYRVDDGDWIGITLPAVKEWSFEETFEDGAHYVEIEVVDRIGNRNSVIINIEVDSAPPVLVISSPIGEVVTSEPVLTIEGTSEPDAIVKVAGEEVELAVDGSFSVEVMLTEGRNLIPVVATDALGNQATQVVTAWLDTTSPVVDLDQSGPWRTNSASLVLSGRKEVNATLYVNGERPSFFASSTFEVTLDLVEGMNTVLIYSVDLADNNWSTSLDIERDSTPPSLTVGSLVGQTNQPTITVKGTTDDEGAIITINGVEVTLTGLAFAHPFSLSEGSNTITVEAMDDLGNAAEPVVRTVVLDTVVPPLTIDGKLFIKTEEDDYVISGSTEPGLTVVVNVVYGAYSKTYQVIAGASGEFEVEVMMPQIGNHTAIVTAKDLAGNEHSETLWLDRERQDEPDKPDGDGTSWIEENYPYVVLVAAVVASLAIWMMVLSRTKERRRALQEARASAAARQAAEEESWEEDGELDEGTEAVEGVDEEAVAEEDWEEER